jgi:transcriptional regulator with XRE-family HTH domain
MELREKLKNLRLQSGMTLIELSRQSGVSKSLLSRIERGQSVPTITTFQKVANALGVRISSLFSDEKEEHSAPVEKGDNSLPAKISSVYPSTQNALNSKGISVVRNGRRKKLIMPWGAY